MKNFLTFIFLFRDGQTKKDKITILLHNILHIVFYPINHLSFLLMKRNLIYPKIFFNNFTIRNSDGLFICRDNVDLDVVSENFESGIRKYFKAFKKGVFVDIGANIGKYSIMIANQLKNNGKVISIEPHPSNFEILKKNIELNDCKNITPINLACWNKKDRLKLYSHENQPLLASAVKPSKNYLNVKADTVDTILKNLKIRNVDMIKIDVEGAEPEVLKGMNSILKDGITKLIFEAWDKNYVDACRKILETYDYKIKHLDKMYWLGFHG